MAGPGRCGRGTFEGAPGFVAPEAVSGRLEGFDAGRDRCAPRSAAGRNALAGGRDDRSHSSRLARNGRPGSARPPASAASQGELQRSLAMHSAVAAAADQGMRQLRVRVAQHRLEPWPVRRALRVVEVDQPLRQPVADGADVAIAAPDAPGIPAPRSPRMPRLLAKLMASSSGRARRNSSAAHFWKLRCGSSARAQHPQTAPKAVV